MAQSTSLLSVYALTVGSPSLLCRSCTRFRLTPLSYPEVILENDLCGGGRPGRLPESLRTAVEQRVSPELAELRG